MSMTSDEVNFLVYRYLQECGFVHSAFTFAYESQIAKSNVVTADIPPGALISFVQKGLQYVNIEAHLNDDGTPRECDEELSLLHPHSCQLAQSGSRGLPKSGKRKRKDENLTKREVTGVDIPSKEVTFLKGHKAEVFICTWSPTENLLASGSGDSTARIWEIPQGFQGGDTLDKEPIVLQHQNTTGNNKDVTTIAWNPSGSMLASGSYDGQGLIWTKMGELKHKLEAHKGPIFALKWNHSGNFLLSGSFDKTAIVWDPEDGKVVKQYHIHNAPTLDVDWRDNQSFATCSTDKVIHYCTLKESNPVMTFLGHQDEVNTVKWSPSGSLLASCSDDGTLKIWNPDKGNQFVHDFTYHTKEIYTIKWSPTGPKTSHPNKSLYLASASFDCTVRLWDVEVGKCLQTMELDDPVYSVAFSPCGDFLAGGALNGALNIWSVKDGSVVKSFTGGKGDLFEVNWNSQGDLVAASFSDNNVCVLNFRK